MSDEDETTVKVDGLKKILKALKNKRPPVLRVGVLKDKNARGDSKTNASIGAVHEFGSVSRNIPPRSFLRMPLSLKLNSEIQSQGLIGRPELNELVKTGDIYTWLSKLGALARDIVLGAFDSNGYGQWPKWKNPYYKNNTGMLLVDTTQLRDSVSWDITK